MEGELVKSSISLTSEEISALSISEEDTRQGYQTCGMSVFAKIWCSDKQFTDLRVQSMFEKVWSIQHSFTVYYVAPNLFQFIIPDPHVRKRALLHGPWNYDNHLVVFRAWEPHLLFKLDSSFITTAFWIQVLDLPLTFLTVAVGEKIAAHLGNCLKVEVRDKGEEGGRVLRLRVEIDISRPLRRGVLLIPPSKDPAFWAPFRYEKLPIFCYKCGCVGHPKQSCSSSSLIMVNQYGPWLRAQGFKGTNIGESMEERIWLYQTSDDSSSGEESWSSQARLKSPLSSSGPHGSGTEPKMQLLGTGDRLVPSNLLLTVGRYRDGREAIMGFDPPPRVGVESVDVLPSNQGQALSHVGVGLQESSPISPTEDNKAQDQGDGPLVDPGKSPEDMQAQLGIEGNSVGLNSSVESTRKPPIWACRSPNVKSSSSSGSGSGSSSHKAGNKRKPFSSSSGSPSEGKGCRKKSKEV